MPSEGERKREHDLNISMNDAAAAFVENAIASSASIGADAWEDTYIALSFALINQVVELGYAVATRQGHDPAEYRQAFVGCIGWTFAKIDSIRQRHAQGRK